MPKRKEPELTPEEQKKRFEALAQAVGARQTSAEFKKTLGKLRMATKPPKRKK